MKRIVTWTMALTVGFGGGGALAALRPGENDRLVVASGLAGAIVALALVELIRIWWPKI